MLANCLYCGRVAVPSGLLLTCWGNYLELSRVVMWCCSTASCATWCLMCLAAVIGYLWRYAVIFNFFLKFLLLYSFNAFSALTLLVGWQEVHPTCRKWVVGCRRGYWSRARCRLAYGPVDATATHSYFSKIQIGFTFVVPAHPGSPGQRAVKRMVCCKLICNIFIPVDW